MKKTTLNFLLLLFAVKMCIRDRPGPDPYNDKKIVDAVRNGELDEAVLDRAAERRCV